jgi:hypothetical protein
MYNTPPTYTCHALACCTAACWLGLKRAMDWSAGKHVVVYYLSTTCQGCLTKTSVKSACDMLQWSTGLRTVPSGVCFSSPVHTQIRAEQVIACDLDGLEEGMWHDVACQQVNCTLELNCTVCCPVCYTVLVHTDKGGAGDCM